MMINLQVLTRELSVYLENQVRVGLFGSGVGLSLVLGVSAAYAWYYLSCIAKRPQLVAASEAFRSFLEQYCPAVTDIYYPTPWCWEGRAQTLLRPFIAYKPCVHYTNELIKTTDGGQISLDWFDNDDSTFYPDSSTRPTIILLPGLTGTSRESYILHMVQQSKMLGYRCVVFNNRGVAGEDLLTPRTYCASNTEDLEAVIHHVYNMYPFAPLMASGVSMGGHRHILEKIFNMDLIMKAKTIREYDKQFTSVMFGYPSIEDYYKDASPCHRLKSVEIPVLCLNAIDDVFSPSHAIPVENCQTKSKCCSGTYIFGGHIGFLEGIWPRQWTYMDRLFKQFVQAIFEHGNQIHSM
ncbi:phospholipase ABHD3 isoform X2 [Rhinatrema bivittatum]|uniref:phospholipase ABHD3 isoform X2 n=1 Tax=Rhinatrema bivittatum TaxID=194408 RepID=UPI001129BC88|nr:phospholipase ABHD3 isoform X2 [Rhinatrema bivittatum]